MTTDPQKIKARLRKLAEDAQEAYQEATLCINNLQAELDDARLGDGAWRELTDELDFDVHPHDVSVADVFEAIEADKNTTTPAPVTAETIRQSEPGSTWEDDEGAVFEWTGSALRWQMGEELGDCDYIGTVDYDLTRSTAAPRGDYGKVEVSTEPRVTIDPAAYETMFSDQEFLQRLHNEITRNRLQGDPATAHERTDDE